MSLHGRFEQVISWILTITIAAIIAAAVFHLVRDVVIILILGSVNPLDHEVFQLIFGGIMTVLIAMEFSHSILRVAARKNAVIQIKTVLLIALLALSRKLIVLDVKTMDSEKVFALAAAVVALGIVYWLLRERHDRGAKAPPDDTQTTSGT